MIPLKTIKGHDAVKRVFWEGRKFKSGPLLISKVSKTSPVLINEYAGADCIYYAVSISKRVAIKASVRNRIKRLLRESLRITLAGVSDEALQRVRYLALSWREAPQHPKLISLKDVLPLVNELIKKMLEDSK